MRITVPTLTFVHKSENVCRFLQKLDSRSILESTKNISEIPQFGRSFGKVSSQTFKVSLVIVPPSIFGLYDPLKPVPTGVHSEEDTAEGREFPTPQDNHGGLKNCQISFKSTLCINCTWWGGQLVTKVANPLSFSFMNCCNHCASRRTAATNHSAAKTQTKCLVKHCQS